MRQRLAFLAKGLLVVVLTACGGRETGVVTQTAATATLSPPPSLADAKTLVANSPEFSDFEFTNAALTLATTRGALSSEQLVAAKDLAAAGWLRLRSDSVELTEKAKRDRRFLPRSNGTVDIVPLASKELVEASAIQSGADGNPQVLFAWRWIPNEIGSSLRSGSLHDRYASPHRATATLMRDGSNWSVLRIRPSEN